MFIYDACVWRTLYFMMHFSFASFFCCCHTLNFVMTKNMNIIFFPFLWPRKGKLDKEIVSDFFFAMHFVTFLWCDKNNNGCDGGDAPATQKTWFFMKRIQFFSQFFFFFEFYTIKKKVLKRLCWPFCRKSLRPRQFLIIWFMAL